MSAPVSLVKLSSDDVSLKARPEIEPSTGTVLGLLLPPPPPGDSASSVSSVSSRVASSTLASLRFSSSVSEVSSISSSITTSGTPSSPSSSGLSSPSPDCCCMDARSTMLAELSADFASSVSWLSSSMPKARITTLSNSERPSSSGFVAADSVAGEPTGSNSPVSSCPAAATASEGCSPASSAGTRLDCGAAAGASSVVCSGSVSASDTGADAAERMVTASITSSI